MKRRKNISVCTCGKGMPFRKWNYDIHFGYRRCPHGKRKIRIQNRGRYITERFPDGNWYGHWGWHRSGTDLLDMEWRRKWRHKHAKRAGVRKKKRMKP